MALSFIKDNITYQQEKNIVRFILDDESRPQWSKALNAHLAGNNIDLQMERKYAEQREIMTNDEKRRRFVNFVSAVKGVKVDLASGPSGYFSPILDTLSPDDTFVITDACPSIIKAHSDACNKENIYVFDMDLDKAMPLKDESVDIITGNYLNNVDNYAALISEVYRCLKPGGKLAVIEIFFEQGCKTYEHLNEQGQIWASFETFVSYCESVGFTYLDSEIINKRKGRISEGDLYPLDDNDCSYDRTIYFEKSKS